MEAATAHAAAETATGEAAAMEAATDRCAGNPATITICAPVAIASTESRSPATAPSRSPTTAPSSIPAAPIPSAVPGASAYEDTTGEPARTVVAVRCASIGSVAVVAVGTSRGANVTRANPNPDANRNPGVGGSYGYHENTQQSEIS
jgi:hypothetical protein